jgi:hypothetical protein
MHARRKVIVAEWGDKPDSVRVALRRDFRSFSNKAEHPFAPLEGESPAGAWRIEHAGS